MIQRYDLVCEYEANIGPLDDGDYVAYADHLAELTTERARADTAERVIFEDCNMSAARAGTAEAALAAERERADRAEAERDALQAEVELWKERAYQLSHA